MVTLGEATIRVRGDGTLLPGDLDRAAGQAGERAADRSISHFRRQWRRKAPLVLTAASLGLGAVGGALLAANAAIFAGMAIAAVASSERVKTAWGDLGKDIAAGAAEDAAVMVPALERIADQLGDTYEDLRPQLRDAFEASTPLVERFVDAVDAAARTALPSLVRAVDEADPVVDGLNSAVGAIADGFAAMVDNLVDDAPEMGSVLATLGDVVGDLLPLIGEIIGTSAELGSVVLPPLAAVIGLLADNAAVLAPLLVAIGPALLAMKVGKALTGPLGALSGTFASLAQNAALASYNVGGIAGGVAGRASSGADRISRGFNSTASAIGKAGAALPVLGVAFGLVAAEMEKSDQKVRDYTDSLLAGGQAAADAHADALKRVKEQEEFSDLPSLFGSNDEALDELKEAEEAVRKYEASLSPLELAQHNVTKSQNDYNYAVDEYGKANPRTLTALTEHEAAVARLEREQARLQYATEGTTEAIVAQAQQILAAADSDLAYRLAIDDTKVAMEEYANVIKEFGPNSEEAINNGLHLEENVLAQANAFAVARADALGLADGVERDGVVAAAALEELERLRVEMGDNFPPALQTTIEKLAGVEGGLVGAKVQADLAKLAAEGLGIAVHNIPGNKTVFIDAPTAEQKQALENLGYAVRTLPDGRVYITAATGDAERDISYVTRGRTVHVKFVQDNNGLAPGGGVYKVNGGKVYEHDGGIVHARKFADGGFMDGSFAQIVQPNTWRVIGDRVTDDEAFIPINNDPRSVAIWEEAGRRMGRLAVGGGPAYEIDARQTYIVRDQQTAEEVGAVVGRRVVRDVRNGVSDRYAGAGA